MSDKSDQPNVWSNPRYTQSAASDDIAESLCRGEVLRQKVKQGCALGTFLIELPCVETLSAIALAGFDFVVLDMEHSSIDFSRLETLIVAGRASGLAVVVRVWGEDVGLIGKVLDIGANGIMAPHVSSAARAREIVEQCRFAPRGGRGFSPLTKYDSLAQPLESLTQSTYVIIQIEGLEAVDRIADIAATPGIDAVFVGPYDLALSLGVAPGSPEVFTAAEGMSKMIPQDLGLGIYIDDPSTSGDWVKRGFSLQCVSFDGRMLADGARLVVSQARKSVSE